MKIWRAAKNHPDPAHPSNKYVLVDRNPEKIKAIFPHIGDVFDRLDAGEILESEGTYWKSAKIIIKAIEAATTAELPRIIWNYTSTSIDGVWNVDQADIFVLLCKEKLSFQIEELLDDGVTVWAAIDENGTLYLYDKRPVQLDTIWDTGRGGFLALRVGRLQPEDWKQSLIQIVRTEPVVTILPKDREALMSTFITRLGKSHLDYLEAGKSIWLAVDRDGEVWDYSERPRRSGGTWNGKLFSHRCLCHHLHVDDWRSALLEINKGVLLQEGTQDACNNFDAVANG